MQGPVHAHAGIFKRIAPALLHPNPLADEKSDAPTGGAGSVIQLGAFQNQAQAERAWSALSARFPSVAAMNKLIIPFSGGIRLRASASSPAEAKQACQALKVAGEADVPFFAADLPGEVGQDRGGGESKRPRRAVRNACQGQCGAGWFFIAGGVPLRGGLLPDGYSRRAWCKCF